MLAPETGAARPRVSQGRLDSFRYALHGVARLRHEPNARLHALATLLVVIASVLARLSAVEWALVSFAIALVFAAEALNTAIEFLADAAVPTEHPLVGRAKDLAAGGVLIASFGAAVVGALVLGPPLWRLLLTSIAG